MFKMSPFSFDAWRDSFGSLAKARNRFADCFIRQIFPDSLHSGFWIHTVVVVSAY